MNLKDIVAVEASAREQNSGDIWYKVSFLEDGTSGAQGWIRGDLLQLIDLPS